MPAQAETLKVFAAASLSDALDEALEVCHAETGTDAIGVYAGSGTAARQVAQGAPASIYISANPQWMDWLEKRELIAADTRIDLLGNRLVMIATPDAYEKLRAIYTHPPDPIGNLGDFRLAVADTESVPAGIYARQALEKSGGWKRLRGQIVQASNVRETLAWVARGEADLGIVYQTDAQNESRVGVHAVFDAEDHDPIRYPAAVVRDLDSPKARGLLACLQGEEASEVFKRFGFDLLN